MGHRINNAIQSKYVVNDDKKSNRNENKSQLFISVGPVTHRRQLDRTKDGRIETRRPNSTIKFNDQTSYSCFPYFVVAVTKYVRPHIFT